MTDHTHEWKAAMVAGGHARWVCACGATGWRPQSGEFKGQIIAHKQTQTHLHTGGKGETVPVADDNMPNGGHRHGKRGPGGW